MSIEQKEITKEYFDTLRVKRVNLFEQAKTAETKEEFMEEFDKIIRINRIQLGLIPQIYPLRATSPLLKGGESNE